MEAAELAQETAAHLPTEEAEAGATPKLTAISGDLTAKRLQKPLPVRSPPTSAINSK